MREKRIDDTKSANDVIFLPLTDNSRWLLRKYFDIHANWNIVPISHEGN